MTEEHPPATTISLSDYGVAEQFRERKPDRMTNSEYIEFLLDSSHGVPDESDAIARDVADRLRDELSPDLGPVREAARSGCKQALREQDE